VPRTPLTRLQLPLTENNVITIEPGVYFNPFTIYASLNDTAVNPYLNHDKMLEYL
jgi:hypothetical protein